MKTTEINRLRKAYANFAMSMAPSGKSVDKKFIQLGFSGVEAEINLLNRALGERSYDAFIEAQASVDVMSEAQMRDEELRTKFADANQRRESANELIGKVVEDSILPGQFKYSILKRYAPNELEMLFESHMLQFQKKISEERERICKLYSSPCVDLHDKKNVSIRKEIYNDVAIDAYSRIGFSQQKKLRKMCVLSKPISPKLALVIEPDVILFEKDYSSSSRADSTYWHDIPICQFIKLVDISNSQSEPLIEFDVVPNSIAATRLFRYSDSCSLEIAIRAHAIWYELTIAPFEETLRNL
jgi:hypothetical protein